MNIRIATFRASVAAISLVAAASAASPVQAGSGVGLNSFSYNAKDATGTIRVISTDKQKWNALTGGVMFEADIDVNTKHPGMVYEVGVTLGECSGGSGNCGTALWSTNPTSRDYSGNPTVGLLASKIAVSGTGITLGDQIIARCNQHLQANGPTKSYSFTHELPSTVILDTEKVWGNVDNYPVETPDSAWPYYPTNDHHRTDTFKVNVVCDPVVKPSTNDVAYDHGAFKVEDVRLFLTTYQNQNPGSNPGTVCPSFKVTARAETSKSGAVQMKLWRQKDGGAITSKVVDAWSSYDAGENTYYARYHEFIDVGVTSTYQFMTEVLGDGPFMPTDGWKDITVHCTDPAGGGFAPAPQDNDDLPNPQASWTGEVIVADSAGHDKSCPRAGQVFFAVTRPAPGNFDYRISCSNGASFEGTATGYDQGSGIFEAYGAHNISINRTRNIQCTLQEMTPSPVTVAVETEAFTCNNPAVEPSADDLVDAPRPNPKKPVKPVRPLVTADPVDPTHDCAANQILVRGKCVNEPKKPTVSILCRKGYELKGRTCVKKPVIAVACDAGEILSKGKCVKKPEISILCKKGYTLVGKTCVKKPVIATACLKGEKLVRGKCLPTKPLGKGKVFTGKLKIEKQAPVRTLKLPAPKTKPALKRIKRNAN